MKGLLQQLCIEATKKTLIYIISEEYNNPSDHYDQLTEGDKNTLIGWINDDTITFELLDAAAPFPLNETRDTIANKIHATINADNASYENKRSVRKDLERKRDNLFNQGCINEGNSYQNQLNNFIMPIRPINGDNCYPLLDKLREDLGLLHKIASKLADIIKEHKKCDEIVEYLGDDAQAYGLENTTAPSL